MIRTLPMDELPKNIPPTLFNDIKVLGYLIVSSMLGLLSAFTSLLGSVGTPITWRTVSAYLLAGALVSAGVTFMVVEIYGFSYFLLGVSVFAGYKAFDTLTLVAVAVSGLVKKVIDLFSKK